MQLISATDILEWFEKRFLVFIAIPENKTQQKQDSAVLHLATMAEEFVELPLTRMSQEALLVLKQIAQSHAHVWIAIDAKKTLLSLLSWKIDLARPVCMTSCEQLLQPAAQQLTQYRQYIHDDRIALEWMIKRWPPLLAEIKKQDLKAVSRLESMVSRVFAAMEYGGFPMDRPQWQKILDEEEKPKSSKAYQQFIAMCGDAIPKDLFGEALINMESETDIRQILQRVLGDEVMQNVDGLSRYQLKKIHHPVIESLLQYRESQKLLSTYGDAFLSLLNPQTKRLHTTFISMGASTGRVASRDPNIQNLPKDERFHRCVRPTSLTRVIVSADYGACELRIAAEMAEDPVFLEAFQRGDDLHSVVAQRLFGVKVSKWENPSLRERAKSINFGLIYGMGAPALSETLKCQLSEAEDLLQQYFKTFPRMRQFLESLVEIAMEKGYSQTLLGRKLYYVTEPGKSLQRSDISRIAKNMPIQGTSADMTKIAMVRVHDRLLKMVPDAQLINTIHDELVLECDMTSAKMVSEILKSEMQAAHEVLIKKIPAHVDIHVGEYWLKN